MDKFDWIRKQRLKAISDCHLMMGAEITQCLDNNPPLNPPLKYSYAEELMLLEGD